MEGRQQFRKRSLVVSLSPTHLLSGKLLRTLASVPSGQSIIADADNAVVSDLLHLGFVVDRPEAGRPSSEHLYDWGVVVLNDSRWTAALNKAITLSDKVCDGGWIFVGAVCDTFPGARVHAANVLTKAIAEHELAVAEAVSVVSDDAALGISAILRRVTELTPP